MSDICDRLRRIGNAGSTESRVALEAIAEIEALRRETGRLRHENAVLCGEEDAF